MSKTLCKAIMKKSSLETKYFKTRSNDSFKAYKNINIFAVDFIKTEKKNSSEI